jgi:hypothetical protein
MVVLKTAVLALLFGVGVAGCASKPSVALQLGGGEQRCCILGLVGQDSGERSTLWLQCTQADFEQGKIIHHQCTCQPDCPCWRNYDAIKDRPVPKPRS